jgi:hypothetical protein
MNTAAALLVVRAFADFLLFVALPTVVVFRSKRGYALASVLVLSGVFDLVAATTSVSAAAVARDVFTVITALFGRMASTHMRIYA